MEGSKNVPCECSLNVLAESSLNILFERSWNVQQEHSENIALKRSKNLDIFLALGTFHGNVQGRYCTIGEYVLRSLLLISRSIFETNNFGILVNAILVSEIIIFVRSIST